MPIAPRGVTEQLIQDWFAREPAIAIHSFLQCLQLGYAPNEPAVGGRSVLAADLERAMSQLICAATTTIAENVFGMVVEYIRALAGKGTIKLFWTNTANDWSDLIVIPIRELSFVLKANKSNESAIRVQTLRLRVISVVLSEEKRAGVSSLPTSLHSAFARHTKLSDWKSFVSKVFTLIVPPRSASEPEEKPIEIVATRSSSARPKKAAAAPKAKKTSAKNAAKMDLVDELLAEATESSLMAEIVSEASQSSHPADEGSKTGSPNSKFAKPGETSNGALQTGENAPQTSEALYDVQVALLHLLEQLYSLLHPRNYSFANNIVDGIVTAPTDEKRFFILDRLNGDSASRLALLDSILMQSFQIDKKTGFNVDVPLGKLKLLNVYLHLRPLTEHTRLPSFTPKSNYNLLAKLLLGVLETLEFPNDFTKNEIASCVSTAKALRSEAEDLANKRTIFNEKEINEANASTQDLLDFVEILS